MRYRERPRPELSVDVPLDLRAGRCIEVWADPADADYGLAISAFRRYTKARNAYLEQLAVHTNEDENKLPEQLRWHGGGAPWSFDYLERTDPAHLADKLASLGLPPDWRPERSDPSVYTN